MEDMKWFVKKFGIIFVILLVMIVSTGIFYEKNARTSSARERVIINFLIIIQGDMGNVTEWKGQYL